ncbi:MAG: PatB family C-S lyase [Oscillospiraceae bacterium]|jgi:cystathionine beta-lyase|nr:PatB family C-S lyase [Oscillospiraceae bacterium]
MPEIFDEIICRSGTGSLKYDMESRGRSADVLPLWVGDMDFRAPQCILDALSERNAHGIYGYTEPYGDYYDALLGWFSRRFGWSPQRDWRVLSHGLMNAIHIAVRALTQPGDAVMITQPVYQHFTEAPLFNNRRLVCGTLIENNLRYTIDFDEFERLITENSVKLYLLCSPHNPAGRVWTRDELEKIAEICLRHGTVVVCDEIHHDFIHGDNRHTIFSSLSPEAADITVLCTSPSKTFNVAGIQLANVFIKNPTLRERFLAEKAAMGLSQAPVSAILACRAGYSGGEPWLCGLLRYLDGNFNLISDYISSGKLPGIKFTKPEATYFAWLDCRALNMEDRALRRFFEEGARVLLSDGAGFGNGGSGFMRLNAACPRTVLKDGLDRIAGALCLSSR